MKNKLLLGCMGVCSVLGVLVACGSGEITSFATDDQVAELTFTTNLEKEKSIKACLADPVCQAEYQTAQNPPSSAVITSSSSIITPTSSTSIIPGSSSSLFQLSSGGGGNPIQSSSSLVIVVSSQSSGGIAGVCAPEPAIVELGQEVTWNFSKETTVPVTQIIAATYDWVFEGGSEVSYSGTGAAAISKKITYSTSGSHSATLSINGDVAMTCSPVQVNGAKITGCTCDVDNASPDVAAGGVATWTVSGCITTANITGYSWDNAIAAPSSTFSHIFTAKGETVTPTLSVYNDDNTVQPVVCPAATAIDANLPDYEMTSSGNTAGVTFEGNVDATIVMNLPQDWHNGTIGTCTFACQVNRGTSGSGIISGTVDEVLITGSDYVTAFIPITSTINGYALKLSLDIGTNASVTCFASH